MTQLDRRIQKLEAVTDTDKVTLISITCLKREGEPPRRMTTDWKGDRFSQDLGESEASFLDRVRVAVDRNRPAAGGVAAVFLRAVDWAL
jgi:hypothetical protein